MPDAEIFGSIDKDRNEMLLECINMVLGIWGGEASYNLVGEFWNVSTDLTKVLDIGQGKVIKPYQNDPHPPIVGTVVAPFSKIND